MLGNNSKETDLDINISIMAARTSLLIQFLDSYDPEGVFVSQVKSRMTSPHTQTRVEHQTEIGIVPFTII